MNLKSQAGFSTLIAGLFVASLVAVLISTVLISNKSLNQAVISTRELSIDHVALIDFGQTILHGYQQAQANSGGCLSNYTIQKATPAGPGICLPNANVCSQSPNSSGTNKKYCIAKSPSVFVRMDSLPTENILILNSPQRKTAGLWSFLVPFAYAQSEIWLPSLSSPPSITFEANACTTGSEECVICGGAGKNAECFRIRICNNGSTTCPSAGTFIEPTFAIGISI